MESYEEWRRRFWILLVCAIALKIQYYYKYIYKEPCMTSLLTGEKWMREVLNGHPIRCINAFRMEPHLFLRLCKELSLKYGLKPTLQVSVIEKVGIFLYIVAIGVSNRVVSERFQRSGDTISRVFHEVLDALSNRRDKCLAHDIIRPRDTEFKDIPFRIANDQRYMPYFKDCIGCIDGTHIMACIPEAEQMSYRGRKGTPTFNVMAACDFDMCFTFVSAGWEGSAHDARVFLHAIGTPSMSFPKPPEGKYYLVDKGYPDRKGYLTPYPKLRYHQSQFQNEPPQNAQETFNRAHSSLRSCIERSFGVLKQRWKILNNMQKYSIETQIRIIVATFALHNFIRMNSSTDPVFQVLDEDPDFIPNYEGRHEETFLNEENLRGRSIEMKNIRNDIASSLWDNR